MHDAEPWQPSVNLHCPLVNVNKKLWKITIFNGKINYNWPCSIAMLNYQRVNGSSTKALLLLKESQPVTTIQATPNCFKLSSFQEKKIARSCFFDTPAKS